MHQDVAEILISEEEIRAKVKELGQQISRDYAGQDLLLVGILRGAMLFMSDLMREIDIPLNIDFMVVSSYGSGTSTSGEVRVLKDLDRGIEGRNVLLIEDIVDTGLTLNYLTKYLANRHPKSLKICTLLNKPSRRQIEVKVDYNGFIIPDKFVVGYGLDYNEYYRNLPYIGVLKPEIYRE
ncbi:hypoxanthine phosphoribosyltransferase [Carboxydothermus ferrireducens]|uniref:Hypoxanthine phosphoribosyltransferase n=1 Tax=Carboxydothermus ferrireducens DSM 11255 TaxID=1119529 RepID=A0ABX2R8U8_9THEO|nr:hypoxanthine phosphoribosyltransferase [Carboxydothermus ferrireducens]NYE56962.1 hypoxanthine phosphoribosyltransferase [Carboxydothermus ferrireducens DSM 11255]